MLHKVKMVKQTYEKAFERRLLNHVEVDGFYVKIDMFKVTRNIGSRSREYNIVTSKSKGSQGL